MALQLMRGGGRDGGGGGKPAAPLQASPMFKAVPAVWEFLTALQWDDGDARRTGTLLFFTEDGRVKCCVNDRDSDRIAFVSGGSVEELYEAIDEGLRDGSLDWRQSRSGAQGKRK